MKKNILFFAMSATLLMSSCSDFLDVQPEGDATTTTYFTNDLQAIDAVDALYERFHQEAVYGRELFWEQGAACDVVWGKTRDFPTLATLKYTGDESPLRTIFDTMYKVMARSNWVIQELLKKGKSTTLSDIEKRSLGEAYFTRGWAHFLIAYRYGLDTQGVPFVRYEDFEGGYDNSIPPQQASVIDNYKLIISDMDKAIEYLPRFEEYGDNDRGRAHDAAAVAFKAKVYAYWATWDATQWGNVISMVNELETAYGRDLAGTYEELFSSDFSKWWNKEYIWTIPGNGGSQGGGSEFPGVVLENKGWGQYNGWGQNKPSYDIYEEMLKDGAGNDRLVRTVLEYGQEFQFLGESRAFYSSSDIESGFMINKYMDPFKYEDAANKGYINTNGFFMMIEGSQLDDYGHFNDIDLLMQETHDFDRTIGAIYEWAAKDGETLVVVTADHETGGLTLVDGDLAEGRIVCKFSTGGHSGVMVPVYAFGPGAEEFTGIFENTAIFDKIKKLLDL
ncbi:alkaline phosphatase [Bacteroides uniformis]|uniref:alkaline phosphatase n=1 Tax=Bacteroides uniformis TaxID=820 RepID=UPI002030D4B9|nr:alkaline phosphatase [Bacteroides uniformis]MCM1626707.1 alkaline phosphatase [Bacteroides uniformis]MCM1632274.1 alkaline phosphatase [Bacteroides uniformis]MCM1664040.1 alkaline phosphatase [Bacteroides uniformis]MCM1702264.1 alkaline phosphatase [Bacteroides uniformis]MCM1838763.1 alkaline phosphatase [Bacteroides uniformis]